MSKLLVPDTNKSWYDELNAISYYSENEFEQEISNHLSDIFPDYIGITFKFTFTSYKYLGSKEPDLLIIKNDLTEWWITEVELSDHSPKHIIEQISVFSRPDIDPLLLGPYIYKKLTEHRPEFVVSENDIINMVKNVYPKVLVIIDEPKSGLATKLKPYGALLCIFQIFKDTQGCPAYRLDGDYPKVIHAESHCRFVKSASPTLEVKTPDIIASIPDKTDVSIINRGKKTTWRKLTTAKKTYLIFAGRELFTLTGRDGYVLELTTNNVLQLQKRT